jgi:GNAT superfamily N-acetyltransferase
MKMDVPPKETEKISDTINNIEEILNSKVESKNNDITLYIYKNINSKEDFELVYNFIIKNISNKEYQPYLAKMLDNIGQNGQMIKPSIWFSGMGEIFSESCSEDIRNAAISCTNYLLSFFSNFEEELLKNVSNENIENYNKTGKFIKFLFYLAKYSKNWSFSEQLNEKLKNKLSKLAEQNPESNYFLSKFSQGVIDGLNHKHNSKAKEIPVFTINSSKQYGAVYEDGLLHISNEEDFNIINEFIEEINSLSSLRGQVDIRQLHNKAVIIFNKIEDLTAKKIIYPEDLLKTFKKETPTENIKELYKNYLFLLDGIMRPILEEEFGEELFLMPIKEQFQFLLYAKDLKVKEIEPIKNFSKKYGIEGFRTFLSIEQGGKEMGDKILELGKEENLPEGVAREIFAKYGEIIDEVDKIVSSLEEKLKDKSAADPISVITVKDNLLKRAKNLLEKYADNLKKDPSEIISELNNLKTDNIVFLSIFQSLHDTKNIKFEDLKDFEFSNHWLVTEKEETEITEIINKNYKNAPKELRETVLNSFLSSINGIQGYYDNIDIYQLKYKDKIVACCKLDYQYPGEDFGKKVYFGSFNVDPDFANGEIGSAMLERTVDEVANNHIIEADCNALSKIGAKYIESGFVAEDFYDFHGWPSFKIIRDDVNNNKIIGKNISREEILSHLSIGFIEHEGKKSEIISAERPQDFTSIFSNLKTENKIVSRYFYDNESKKWIIVVEPN